MVLQALGVIPATALRPVAVVTPVTVRAGGNDRYVGRGRAGGNDRYVGRGRAGGMTGTSAVERRTA
jgi:hypothetical protein